MQSLLIAVDWYPPYIFGRWAVSGPDYLPNASGGYRSYAFAINVRTRAPTTHSFYPFQSANSCVVQLEPVERQRGESQRTRAGRQGQPGGEQLRQEHGIFLADDRPRNGRHLCESVVLGKSRRLLARRLREAEHVGETPRHSGRQKHGYLPAHEEVAGGEGQK